MKYKDIKDFHERCDKHPDHQSGMISYSMLERRLHEEIKELRQYIEQRKWVGLTDDEIDNLYEQHHNQYGQSEFLNYERAIEAKLKEKNT